MARPMMLIKQELLKPMYAQFKTGVPVLKLQRKYELTNTLTPPTLAKLLKTVGQWDAVKDEGIKKDIHASLFPDWLNVSASIVAVQPLDWYYTGSFPVGKWIKREGVSDASK